MTSSQCFSERILAIHFPTWSVAALGYTPDDLVAVVHQHHIITCSEHATEHGVCAGMSMREAQGICPELHVVFDNCEQASRRFERIVSVIEEIAPRLAVRAPGTCLVPTRGPSRYFGGDAAFIHHLSLVISEALRDEQLVARCSFGLANGEFAALLAAQQATRHDERILIIEDGETASYLHQQPITVLPFDFHEVLWRMGIRTLGAFARLSASDVIGRFGTEGQSALHLARGESLFPFASDDQSPTFAFDATYDPPLAYSDQVAFVARTLSHQLCDRLRTEGLSCLHFTIAVQRVTGEEHARTWSHDGPLTEAHIAERVRWQLDSWLTNHSSSREYSVGEVSSTDGISLVRIFPGKLVPHNGTQLDLWDQHTAVDEHVTQAVARVCGLLGEDAVMSASLQGSRLLSHQVRYQRWNPVVIEDPAESVRRKHRSDRSPPWPGQLPPPYPATVFPSPLLIEVTNAWTQSISVDAQGELNSTPERLCVNGKWKRVVAWAGPWPVDEHWWDKKHHHRCARFQFLTNSGDAYLVVRENQQWWLHGQYD